VPKCGQVSIESNSAQKTLVRRARKKHFIMGRRANRATGRIKREKTSRTRYQNLVAVSESENNTHQCGSAPSMHRVTQFLSLLLLL